MQGALLSPDTPGLSAQGLSMPIAPPGLGGGLAPLGAGGGGREKRWQSQVHRNQVSLLQLLTIIPAKLGEHTPGAICAASTVLRSEQPETGKDEFMPTAPPLCGLVPPEAHARPCGLNRLAPGAMSMQHRQAVSA